MLMQDVNEVEKKSDVADADAISTVADYMEKVKTGIIDPATAGNKGTTGLEEAQGFDIIVDLPSRGKLYPEGTVIRARPLKVIEIKKLSSLSEDTANYVINDILRSATRGIDIADLYIADKIFLIFWLRSQSFKDPNYVVDYTCQNCGNDSSYHFDVDTLNITKLSDDFNPNVKLPNGDEVVIDYLTVKDELASSTFAGKFDAMLTNDDIEVDEDLLSLSYIIRSVNGKALIDYDRYLYVYNMSPEQYSYLISYVKEFSIGVSPVISAKCEKCGGESLVGVTFREEFFLPKYKVR